MLNNIDRRSFFVVVSGVIALGTSAVYIHSGRLEKERYKSWIEKTIEARVGEIIKVDNFRPVYKGMDDNNTKFILGDVHYPIEIREFSMDVHLNGIQRLKFRLNEVSPEKISLTYLGKEFLSY